MGNSYECKTCNKEVGLRKDESPWYPYCYECYKNHKNVNSICECISCGVCTCGIEGEKENACNIGCCSEAKPAESDSVFC